jgi:hypothetical protein
MTQNIIALVIVFSAAAYVVLKTVLSILGKKTSKCDGCPGCDMKNLVIAKQAKISNTKCC